MDRRQQQSSDSSNQSFFYDFNATCQIWVIVLFVIQSYFVNPKVYFLQTKVDEMHRLYSSLKDVLELANEQIPLYEDQSDVAGRKKYVFFIALGPLKPKTLKDSM